MAWSSSSSTSLASRLPFKPLNTTRTSSFKSKTRKTEDKKDRRQERLTTFFFFFGCDEKRGKKYDEDEHPKASELLQILDEWQDFQFAVDEDKSSEANKEMDLDIQQQGDGVFVNNAKDLVEKAHGNANIICSKFCPVEGFRLIASGGSDRQVIVWYMKNKSGGGVELVPFKKLFPHTGAILEIDWHPIHPNVILTSSMDGTVSVHVWPRGDYDALREALERGDDEFVTNQNMGPSPKFNKEIHQKYVNRIRWLSGGRRFISGSYDRSVQLFELVDGKDILDEEIEFKVVKRWDFTGTVEGLEVTSDQKTAIASVRDDNYLNYIDLETFEIERINMNSNGDNHVSFTAMDLRLSPSGNHLLVSTDRDRLIIMRTFTSLHIRNLYGAFNNSFSQPRTVWHPSGKYVFSVCSPFLSSSFFSCDHLLLIIIFFFFFQSDITKQRDRDLGRCDAKDRGKTGWSHGFA